MFINVYYNYVVAHHELSSAVFGSPVLGLYAETLMIKAYEILS